MHDGLGSLQTILDSLHPNLLQGMLRGVERETLRIQPNGFLAKTPHPQSLGSALTHPHITTDYSENLLEFVTAPQTDIPQLLKTLDELHAFTYQHLTQNEQLWALSMPCMLDNEDAIPLAQYGSSNIGRFKTLYRRGLGVRYGRWMQTIAGVHYNLSFPDTLFLHLQQQESDTTLKQLTLQDYRSERYFGLIRNFLRLMPMVVYLLGASPALCQCLVTGRSHQLQHLGQGTLYLPEATALRMGRLGYQNSAQRSLGIHYNHLAGYLTEMQKAVQTPYEPFQTLGLEDEQGQPLQINDHILQIENEYYSLIRPKQIPQAEESPSAALAKRGIAYVELRAVDVDPFSPCGLNAHSAAFLECLALYCLLLDSPMISEAEQPILDANHAKVVELGRTTGLTLDSLQGEVDFKSWLIQHTQALSQIAQCLDQVTHLQNGLYQQAIDEMLQRCQQVEQTPSARLLTLIQHHGGLIQTGTALTQHHADYYAQYNLSTDTLNHLHTLAQQSLQQQAQLEAHPQVSFNDYLTRYRTTSL